MRRLRRPAQVARRIRRGWSCPQCGRAGGHRRPFKINPGQRPRPVDTLTRLVRLWRTGRGAEALRTRAPILVIESETSLRESIRLALEREGYTTDVAADGREAFSRMRTRRPRLIVLDLVLPGIDPAVVVAAARATFGERLPVVAITPADSPSERAQAMQPLAQIQRPFIVRDLVKVVRAALSSRMEAGTS